MKQAIPAIAIHAFLMAVLSHGLPNHRSAQPSGWLIGRQLATLSGCLVLVIATWLAVTLG